MNVLEAEQMAVTEWPSGTQLVRAYAEAFSRLGSQGMIQNLRTRVRVLTAGRHALPLTVNDSEYGDTYVCSPHTAYSLYAKEEIRLIPNAGGRWALGGLAEATGWALQAARINHMAQINNWMLSTNLYPANLDISWTEVTRLLVAEFPRHFLCLRSLNAWTNEALMRQLQEAGYKLVASRQVYAFERLAETWAKTYNAREDRRLLARTPYRVVTGQEIADSDFPRMAELYRLLYIEKYSRYNPGFTVAYLRHCHGSGLMRFFGLRGADGILAGVLGLFAVDGVVTAPIVGYDTRVPRKGGLYRLLMTLVFEEAMRTGERVNLSSGAAEFKRLRGGRGVIEYSAIYDRHLAVGRRAVVNGLGAITNRIGVPLMRKLKL